VSTLVVILLIAALIGFVVWQLSETRNAVATTTVVTSHDPDTVERMVQAAFSGPRALIWTRTAGAGTINMRRRGFRRGITMSIALAPRAGGGTEVDMWASETLVYLFVLVNFAGVVNRRKKAIARALLGDTLAVSRPRAGSGG
jgi:hypothetical protein